MNAAIQVTPWKTVSHCCCRRREHLVNKAFAVSCPTDNVIRLSPLSTTCLLGWKQRSMHFPLSRRQQHIHIHTTITTRRHHGTDSVPMTKWLSQYVTGWVHCYCNGNSMAHVYWQTESSVELQKRRLLDWSLDLGRVGLSPDANQSSAVS